MAFIWLLPSGFAFGSAMMGVGMGWLILNLLFTTAVGVFFAVEPRDSGTGYSLVWSRFATFMIVQIVVIPLIVTTAVFAICSFNPIHI